MTTETEEMDIERERIHQQIVQFGMRYGINEASVLAVGTLIVLAAHQGLDEVTYTSPQGEVTVLVANKTH